jgi:hypothetical protein
MVTPLRSQVLAHYKKLLHTAQVVFQNDPTRIASEFRYNKKILFHTVV